MKHIKLTACDPMGTVLDMITIEIPDTVSVLGIVTKHYGQAFTATSQPLWDLQIGIAPETAAAIEKGQP